MLLCLGGHVVIDCLDQRPLVQRLTVASHAEVEEKRDQRPLAGRRANTDSASRTCGSPGQVETERRLEFS